MRIKDEQVIQDLIDGYSLESFVNDEKTKRAVCMTLINIGELAKSITDELRAETPYISWRGISGMRDITAHKYQTLRMEDVWYTVVSEIPKLRGQLVDLISSD